MLFFFCINFNQILNNGKYKLFVFISKCKPINIYPILKGIIIFNNQDYFHQLYFYLQSNKHSLFYKH